MKLCTDFKQQLKAKIVISDPDGSNAKEYEFNSFIRNFFAYMISRVLSIATIYPKNTSGTNLGSTATLQQSLITYAFHGGMLLGTGSPARSIGMYQMGSVITPSDLDSSIPTYTITVGASTCSIEIAKNFENISGGDIDITEIAMSYVVSTDTYALTFMLSHDVISPAYTLADGALKRFSIVMTLDETMNENTAGVMRGVFTNASQEYTDIGNTSRAQSFNYNANSVLGVANVTTQGIVVGTDDTANTVNDYKLGAQIDNATLAHGSTYYVSAGNVEPDNWAKIQREFTNVTAGDVTINEVGIYLKATAYYMMFYRKVLTTPLTIAAGQSQIIEWVFQTTFE